MGMKRKAQYSVFDVLFMLLFVVGIGISVITLDQDFSIQDEDFSYRYLEILLNQDFFISLVENEDLSISTITQNWSSLIAYLNLDNTSLFLKIENHSVSKQIFNCTSTLNSFETSYAFLVVNSSLEIRSINFGVCQ